MATGGNLFAELKRRNVFRVGAAYAVVGWIIAQVGDLAADNLAFPEWFMPMVLVVLALGLPVAMFLAWAFELTPDGVKRTEEVGEGESVAAHTGQKLNYLIIGSLVIALGYFVWESRFASAPEGEVPRIAEVAYDKSVAVLPFADMSEGGDQGWFSDGLTEEVLNSLARLPELKVTARTSAFQFKGQDRNISEIAAVLGVAHVVEGSVRRIDNRLRVTAQLIRARDGFHLWSDTYDSTTDNLFDVQTDVAEKIATTLDVFLDEEKRELLFASGTRNVEALEAYLKGKDLTARVHAGTTDKTLWDANVLLQRAMDLDPEFGTPAITHHDAYAHVLMDGPSGEYVRVEGKPPLSQEEAMALLLADLDHAISAARDPATRLVGELSREFFSPTWHRMPGLIARFREEVDAERLDDEGTVWLTNILVINNALDVERVMAEGRVKKDPLDPTSWSDLADVEIKDGNFEAAREIIRRGRATAGDHRWMRGSALYAAVYSGNREEAISLLEAYGSDEKWYPAYLAALRGDYARATRLADELMASRDWPEDFVLLVYNETGDKDRARALAQRIDALPAGAAIFTRLISISGNRLAFDLEDAPNFAARLREAAIDPTSFLSVPRLSVTADSAVGAQDE